MSVQYSCYYIQIALSLFKSFNENKFVFCIIDTSPKFFLI